MSEPVGPLCPDRGRIDGHHNHCNPLKGYNDLPVYRPEADVDDRASSKIQLADSQSKGEFYALGDIKPVEDNFFSLRYLLRGCGAYLNRFLSSSKIGQGAEADRNTQLDAKKSLKKVLGLDGLVNHGNATSKDAITKPSPVIEGLVNERESLAIRFYESLKSRCYRTLLVIALSKKQSYLGMTNFIVYSYGCRLVLAAPIGQPDVDCAIDRPLAYLYIVGVLFVSNIVFAVATTFGWVESRSEATGGNTLPLAIGTIVFSVLTMIVLYDTKHFPILSPFLMIPSSFAHFAAMVYNFDKKLKHRSGTLLDSLAAVPIILPSSAWMVYTCVSLERQQHPPVSSDSNSDNMSGTPLATHATSLDPADAHSAPPASQGTTVDHSSL